MAIPNEDWIFVIWTENGKVVSTTANYSFTVNENRNLVANFMQQKFKITTTANPTIGGTISGGGSFDYSNLSTVKAVPNAGWYFVNWTESGNLAATDTTYSFNVIENRNLTANFTQQRIFIAADANPGPGGIIQGGGYYGVGSLASVIATPVSGYTFIDWSESGKQVSTNPVYDFTANTNRTLIANFHLTTGIVENQFSIEVFPNPTSGIVNVKSSQVMDKIVICNSMGAIVRNIGSRHSEYKIDLSGLTKGIYILRLYIDNKETTRKIVLN